MHRFEERLGKDIFKKMIHLTLAMGIVLLSGFLGIILLTNSEQLHQQTVQIESKILQEKREIQIVLEQLNQEEARRFLLEKSNERLLISAIYEAVPQTKNALYFLTDDNGNILYETPSKDFKQGLMTYYLKTVVQNAKKKQAEYSERITYDSHHQGYYIALAPLRVDSDIKGYSILAIPGENIFGQAVDNLKYMIAGRFDDVLFSNTNQFMNEQTFKVDTAAFQSPWIFHQQWLALTRRSQVTEDIYLYTYLHVINMHLFLILVSLFLVVWIISQLIMSKFISKKVAHENAQSVDELVADTKLIMRGYQFHIKSNREDEFGYLAQQINQMMDSLYRLYNNSLDLEKQKSIVERKLLEAQFNPHFLYNTLETIRVTVFLDPNLSEKLILCLNRILRYSLNEAIQQPLLMDDLKILDDFLQINQVRFEQLVYTIEIEDDVLGVAVPKLFLLSLVENALKYGMKSRTDLTITVRGYRVQDGIIFEVDDNGRSFNRDITSILEEQQYRNETYHGLSNTYRRLSFMFRKVTMQHIDEEGKQGIRVIVTD